MSEEKSFVPFEGIPGGVYISPSGKRYPCIVEYQEGRHRSSRAPTEAEMREMDRQEELQRLIRSRKITIIIID